MGSQERSECLEHIRFSYALKTKLLEESNKMIDDSAERLGKVAEELRELVVRLPASSALCI